MKREHFDLAVIGSGFAGSLMSMAARRLGLSVVMIERERHPRFAIGESTTPLTNLLLEEICDEFQMPEIRSLSKWGTWQGAHPDIPCGLKRGFTFYKHELGQRFPTDPGAALGRQLMVGASPNERVADTHWFRPEFDRYLAERAAALGVDYRDETELQRATEEPGHVLLSGVRAGEGFEFSAGFVVDAGGPRGFLHRSLRLQEKPVEGFPPTQALYAHFEGVPALPAAFSPGVPPFPPEQAAVHHVFDGGWVWVLRFNNGITSAGVVAVDAVAERLKFRNGQEGWSNVLRELPSVGEQFASARATMPFVWLPRTAFQSGRVAGKRWALLPSAAGVIDPLLSTGFPLALLGVQRLARLMRSFGRPEFEPGLIDYENVTTREFEATARLIKALYARMGRFDDFKQLSLLYFTAASFSEAARRLGKNSLVPEFLLCGHPVFGPRLKALCLEEPGRAGLASRVRDAVEAYDVAGFTDASRDPWYPASPADLYKNGGKLDASSAEIDAMLARCGLR
jgi:tetracycline 7-halogenase / FADH2 O2-dependent halogenase